MYNSLKSKKILVTGGNGFLGQYVVRELMKRGVSPENITIPRSASYDLRNQKKCAEVLKEQAIVIHLAAKVGGIGYNLKKPGELFYDNALMGINLIEEARRAGVEKFVAIGTVCAYPKFTPVPFKEKNLWDGYPEETNASYGLAKKMMLVQGQAYRTQYGFNTIFLLPVNLYGPGDNFNSDSSHVIPALIQKFLDAKKNGNPEVVVWGTGRASREFLFVEDAARAIVLATQKYDKEDPVNIGSSSEITIKRLAEIISKLVNFKGKLVWDASKPDGQPRRKLDTSKAYREFGFKSSTTFEKGLRKTIRWYRRSTL